MERRQTPRILIRKLAYINVEPNNNGGVITDVSETGLRFRTVEPVEQGGVLRLSIVLGAADPIEAVGELVWTDASRMAGGLRFTILPPGAADQIRRWAEASNSADASRSAASLQSGAIHGASLRDQAPLEAATTSETRTAEKLVDSALPQAAPAPGRSDPGERSPWMPPSGGQAADAPTAQARPPALPNPGDLPPWVRPEEYQQPTPMPGQSSPMPWITHFDPEPSERAGAPFFRGVLGGIVLCAMLGSAAWFVVRYYGRQNVLIAASPRSSHEAASAPVAPPASLAPADSPSGANTPDSQLTNHSQVPPQGVQSSANSHLDPSANVQPHPGAQAAGTSAGETTAGTAAGDSASAQTPPLRSPVAQLAPPATLSSNKGSLGAPSQGEAKVPSPQPLRPDDGESQLMLARQYLDGSPRNPMVASQLLWSAIEKGNSAAEIALADLYLRGDGVGRNCDQARVLLSAASQKGNAQAMEKLQELNRSACR